MIVDMRNKEQSLAGRAAGQSYSPQEIQAEVFVALDKEYGWLEGTFAQKLPALAQKIKDDTTASPLDRAYAAYAEGNFDEAEKLFVENVQREQKQRAANILESYENAGWSAQKAHRYDAAIGYFQEASQYTNQTQDPIRWAETQHALGDALHRAGHYREAECILRNVVKQRKESLAKHLDTLVCRNNLANTLCAQGKYAEAEIECRTVLKLREEVLGAKHLHTLVSRNNLAGVLYAQGKYAEAAAECRMVLKLREKVLADDHSEILKAQELLRLIEEGKDKGNLRM